MATLYTQPQFDPRIRTLTFPLGSGTTLTRGFMIWDQAQKAPQGYQQNSPAVVYFLYNPSTVSGSYQMADSSVQSAMQYPVAGDDATFAVPLQQQITWSMLFDRTYELWGTSGKPKVTDLQNMGVDVDVRAMRQFTGMYSGNQIQQNYESGSGENTNGSPFKTTLASGSAGSVSQGIMVLILSYVYFGHPGTGISFYGYVDSWSVQYTHWTVDMVPMRAVIDVSFTLLPPPAQQVPPSQTVYQTQGSIYIPGTGTMPIIVGSSTTGVSGR